MKKHVILIALSITIIACGIFFFYANSFEDNNGISDVTICSVENNTIKSEYMGVSGHVKIDLSEVWDEESTFSFPYLDPDYRGLGDIHLDIKNNGDKLISAKEETTFIPYLWAEMDANVLQYISMPELEKSIYKELYIKNGIVTYPEIGFTSKEEAEIDQMFSDITKEQILAIIRKDKYLDKSDKNYYLKYANDYKPGAFKCHGMKYSLTHSFYSIILTYEGRQGTYEKRINYSCMVGN
jgi:hypothetical protein